MAEGALTSNAVAPSVERQCCLYFEVLCDQRSVVVEWLSLKWPSRCFGQATVFHNLCSVVTILICTILDSTSLTTRQKGEPRQLTKAESKKRKTIENKKNAHKKRRTVKMGTTNKKGRCKGKGQGQGQKKQSTDNPRKTMKRQGESKNENQNC